jgi:hypothetical protein
VDWLTYVDPYEVTDGIKPTKLKQGVYHFSRGSYESEIAVEEPGGNSFLLGYFEFEKMLRYMFKLNIDQLTRLVDATWNFNSTYWDTKEQAMTIGRI